ncbi:hypothetical protein J6TS2_51370 [Heyndrickxia sporothermodurans]|nr:hypothetical protein J6TS2_51370 [Heyndrickxia sporothermodurans]
MQTTEFRVENGKKVPYQVKTAFRKYSTWYESLQDLATLYLNGVSWDRNKYKKIIGETDYIRAAMAVQSAGYATDPKYAEKIIKIIELNGLTKYDRLAHSKTDSGNEIDRYEI